MAKELKRFAVLRSWNPMNGSHGTADAYVMSGHKFNPAVTYPHMGSVVSHEFGPRKFGGFRIGLASLRYRRKRTAAPPTGKLHRVLPARTTWEDG